MYIARTCQEISYLHFNLHFGVLNKSKVPLIEDSSDGYPRFFLYFDVCKHQFIKEKAKESEEFRIIHYTCTIAQQKIVLRYF